MSSALLIIAQKGYQDIELQGTRDGLLSAGFLIVLSSSNPGICTGKLGGSEMAAIALRDVDVDDYDRIAFIGGPGAGALADDPDAQRIAREALAHGKKLGAICIAPTILAKAGVLKGKKATVWDSGGEQVALLKENGATYTGEPVTVDGDLVTANGPGVAKEFGKTLASM